MHRIVVHPQDRPAQVVRVAAGIEERRGLNLIYLIVQLSRALLGYPRQPVLQVESVCYTLASVRLPTPIVTLIVQLDPEPLVA
jgi:hypothetical protein